MATETDPINGQDASAARASALFDGIGGKLSYVETGYTVTNGGGLNASVAVGVLYNKGYRVKRDTVATVALTDAATNRIWVYPDLLTVNTVTVAATTSDTLPTPEAYKIAEVVTAAGAITTITDKRTTRPTASGAFGFEGNVAFGPHGATAPEQRVHILETSGDAVALVEQVQGASNVPAARFRKARGTPAAKAVVQNGDVLAQWDVFGYDGDQYVRAAIMRVVVDGAPGDNDMPARYEIQLTRDGESDVTGILTLKSDGSLTLDTKSLSATGQRDSGAFTLVGYAHDGTTLRKAEWRAFVDITSDSGASRIKIESQLAGGGWNQRLYIDENGVLDLNTSVGVALGGGAAPTLGTIGGSGPATAAQNKWAKIKINGTDYFVPVWV